MRRISTRVPTSFRGKFARVRLNPHKVGTFTFLCDIFCGTKHEEMNGRLTVIE